MYDHLRLTPAHVAFIKEHGETPKKTWWSVIFGNTFIYFSQWVLPVLIGYAIFVGVPEGFENILTALYSVITIGILLFAILVMVAIALAWETGKPEQRKQLLTLAINRTWLKIHKWMRFKNTLYVLRNLFYFVAFAYGGWGWSLAVLIFTWPLGLIVSMFAGKMIRSALDTIMASEKYSLAGQERVSATDATIEA